MLTIDGSQGEGGGQIVRTALSLAMASGTAFRLDNIRAGRDKPGLLRQHLACVQVAKQLASARVLGDNVGSSSLVFEPHAMKGGVFDLAIGAAASIPLLLQTVIPPLLLAEHATRLTLAGTTHSAGAPTFEQIDETWLPLLARMGATIEVKLLRAGFQTAGGGKVTMRVERAKRLRPLTLDERGTITLRRVRATVANLPFEIADREVKHAVHLLSWPEDAGEARGVDADGPGNCVAITLGSEHVTAMFSAFGGPAITAEAMVERLVDDVRAHLVGEAPVGPHLADQLLIPMALAGSGSIVTGSPSSHARTTMALIEKFLPVEFTAEPIDDRRWRITVES